MAGSRIERISSIFKRVEGLYKAGALSEENLPIWYHVYKAFPPKEEPKLNRPEPKVDVKNLVFREDYIIRDFLQSYTRDKDVVDLFHSEKKSLLDRYVEHFKQFAKDGTKSVSEIKAAAINAVELDGYKLYSKEQSEKEKVNYDKNAEQEISPGNKDM